MMLVCSPPYYPSAFASCPRGTSSGATLLYVPWTLPAPPLLAHLPLHCIHFYCIHTHAPQTVPPSCTAATGTLAPIYHDIAQPFFPYPSIPCAYATTNCYNAPLWVTIQARLLVVAHSAYCCPACLVLFVCGHTTRSPTLKCPPRGKYALNLACPGISNPSTQA